MVCAQLRAVLSVAATVNDRFVRSGVSGLEGALAAARQIESVLAGIDPARLATLRESVVVLERELRSAGQLLARLRVVKEIVDRAAT